MSCSSVGLLYPVSTELLYRVNMAGTSFTDDSFLHGSGFGADVSFPLVSAAPGALGCSSDLTCHPLVLLSHDCPSISVGVLGFENEYGFSTSCLRLSSLLDGQYFSVWSGLVQYVHASLTSCLHLLNVCPFLPQFVQNNVFRQSFFLCPALPHLQQSSFCGC